MLSIWSHFLISTKPGNKKLQKTLAKISIKNKNKNLQPKNYIKKKNFKWNYKKPKIKVKKKQQL